MTAGPEAVAAALAAAPREGRPWLRPTLEIVCPACEAESGSLCVGPRGQDRRQFHLERYALARALAGVPLARFPLSAFDLPT